MHKLAPVLLIFLLLLAGALFTLYSGFAPTPVGGETGVRAGVPFSAQAPAAGTLRELSTEASLRPQRVSAVDWGAPNAVAATDNRGPGTVPSGKRQAGQWVRIEGQVVDESGEPVAARRLTFDLLSKSGLRQPRMDWTIQPTDDEGRFTLEGPAEDYGSVVLRGGNGSGVLPNLALELESVEGLIWVQRSEVLVRGQLWGLGLGASESLRVRESGAEQPANDDGNRKVLKAGTVSSSGFFELPLHAQRASLRIDVRAESGATKYVVRRHVWRELAQAQDGLLDLGAIDLSEHGARIRPWLLDKRTKSSK